MESNAKAVKEPGVGSFMPYSMGESGSEVGAVTWNKELETGIELLDEQHRRYVELLNDYIEKAAEYTSTPEKKVTQLTRSLSFLRQYAQEHFSTENAIMENAAYPDFEEHHEQHLYFLKHVSALCEEMEATGFSHKLSREVNYYTIEWFIDHILDSDMQLVEFLKIRSWSGSSIGSTAPA